MLDVQLIPRDLRPEHEERTEELQLFVAGRQVLDGQDGQNVLGEIGLHPRIRGGDFDTERAEHLFAVRGADHGGQTRVLESFLDALGVIRAGACDRHHGSREDLVERVVEGVRFITQTSGVRRGHHARRHAARAAASKRGDRAHQHRRITGGLVPGFHPALELGLERDERRPQRRIDAAEQFSFALVGDEVAIETRNGLEDFAIGRLRDLLAELEVFLADRLGVLIRKRLHFADEQLRDVEQADSIRERSPRGRDDRRLIDLQRAAGLQRREPRFVVRNVREHVRASEAHGRVSDRDFTKQTDRSIGDCRRRAVEGQLQVGVGRKRRVLEERDGLFARFAHHRRKHGGHLICLLAESFGEGADIGEPGFRKLHRGGSRRCIGIGTHVPISSL